MERHKRRERQGIGKGNSRMQIKVQTDRKDKIRQALVDIRSEIVDKNNENEG